MTERPARVDGPAAATTSWQPPRALFGQLRRLGHQLRTEGGGAQRETAAIGLGVFIGCLPFYGFHLLICAFTGWLLGVNRLKMYLAANISNPLVAPWLILAETQIGARIRHGAFVPLTREGLAALGLSTLAIDLLTGSIVLGATLGAVAAAVTYASRRGHADNGFDALVREAADRYAVASLVAWEFARGKLRHDPVYRAAACEGLLPSGGTLLDLGCGQGLMLAILAAVRRRAGTTAADGPAPPPVFERLVGIDTRPRVTALARAALGGDAEIITGDVRNLEPIAADAVIVFDVLHMIPEVDQESLIALLAGSLQPGAVMLVREADADAGWRFSAVRIGNRLKALVSGRARQPFHFRSAAEWQACFERHGLRTDVMPMGTGTPFGNVLIRATWVRRADR